MVAPTRTPQARGAKCDLCKKILLHATWLDQTKLAQKPDDARKVIAMIDEHNLKDCPCIPKNIENLLVGSTHFEMHRLLLEDLDISVHKRQSGIYHEVKLKNQVEASKSSSIINDCYDTKRNTRFKILPDCFDFKHLEISRLVLRHIESAIDSWARAIEDQANPFNSKLALRLGVTHHVVYASYFFKYHRLLDYQLKTSILLLNVFKSVEGVTPNAMIHANYLLTRALMDCAQYDLARQQLKQATKQSSYSDKSSYESILLNCVACELRLLDGSDADRFSILDDLAELTLIQKDDKLQHYYARTLAMSTIMRYIHYYKARSENCFEFFHTFRFVCAILRRCYETSFELVVSEKGSIRQRESSSNLDESSAKQNFISSHNWIRFAVCDFSFATFEILANFYMRAGMPECLELLFNGLSLISCRTGSIYWQSRVLSIGIDFDLLCDKSNHAKEKLATLTKLVSFTKSPSMMNILRIESEISFISLLGRKKKSVIKRDVIIDLLNRIKVCQRIHLESLKEIKFYDCKSGAVNDLTFICNKENSDNLICELVIPSLLHMALKLLKTGIRSLIDVDVASQDAKYLLTKIADGAKGDCIVLDFNACQILFEIILQFADINRSEQLLLETVKTSSFFLRNDDGLTNLQGQFSSLSLNDGKKRTTIGAKKSKMQQVKRRGSKVSRINISRRSRRKRTYEVAMKSDQYLSQTDQKQLRIFNPIEALENFPSLTQEEILLSYLRYSEPNPDFSMYRRANEILLRSRLEDGEPYDNDQILFHLTESISSNTMRYRWMMYEEQQICPFDTTVSRSQSSAYSESNCIRTRHTSFCNSTINTDKVVRSMTRTIPDDFRLCQFKYLQDLKHDSEHLIIACIDNTNNLVCFHTKRALTSDDFFDDAAKSIENLTIPNRFETKIEESRRALISNSRTRSDLRQRIEADIGVLLHDIEDEWLGPFRFILCGKVNDYSYNKMISDLMGDIHYLTSSEHQPAFPDLALRMLLEGAPLVTREEFCTTISALYNCSSNSDYPRSCYNLWLKAIESYLSGHAPNMCKTSLLKALPRGQIGIILDQNLEQLPFESLPVNRIIGQGIFRVPSLRLYSLLTSRRCLPVRIDTSKVGYVLDPANNLGKTRDRFELKLRNIPEWKGTSGSAPDSNSLMSWLSKEHLYIFIGHGAGTCYYNKLCKGKGLSALEHIESMAIVMGCSSGRMMSEGPQLESFGVGWAFLFRGAPCYLGLLWDVTDTDIDKFTDYLLAKWIPTKWHLSDSTVSLNSSDAAARDKKNDSVSDNLCITEASTMARHVCKLKFLVGSAPVVYGLPVACRN